MKLLNKSISIVDEIDEKIIEYTKTYGESYSEVINTILNSWFNHFDKDYGPLKAIEELFK